MTKQTNLPPNSHITLEALLCACSLYNIHRGALGTTVNPDIPARYVWTGEFDSNTPRVDVNFLNPQQKICGFKNIQSGYVWAGPKSTCLKTGFLFTSKVLILKHWTARVLKIVSISK